MSLRSKKPAILVALGALLMGSTFLSLLVYGIGTISVPTKARAAATNDVQYSSVLDYSASDILLETSGFVASTTFDCSLSTLACSQVPSSTESLLPSSITVAQSAGTSYYASPDYTKTVILYTDNQVPTAKLYSTAGNSLTLIATLPTLNAPISNIHWSGDNSVLLITETNGSVQKYDSVTGKLTSLTSTIPSGASWITVSPNGQYLAYYIPAVISSGQRTFGVIDTDADATYTLQESIGYWDLLSEGVRVFAFSPDSTHLLYLDDRSGYQTLYNVDLTKLSVSQQAITAGTAGISTTITDTLATTTTGAIIQSPLAGTQVTAKPYAIGDMQWISNSTIVFTANRTNPLQWSLYKLNLNTYALTKITDFVAAYDQPMQKIGSALLFETADANGRLVKVFNTLTSKVESFQIPGVDQSKVGSANKVVENDGLYSVYMPTTTATSTLLVWLHGGPDRQSAIEYNSYMSYGGYDWVLDKVQAAGVPVLKVDYPGSVGQSNSFASSVKYGVGTTDASTTMQAIHDFATAHGYTNIYIMGNSYGGYLGLKLLVSYPSQIEGMLSLSSVTDWQTLLTNIPSSIFSLDFNGSPNPANQSLYNAASIINNLNAIGNQKVIVVQGDVDDEVPYQQSQLLDKALVAAGKNVEYYTLTGESHIYEDPSSYTLVCNKAFELVGLTTSSTCIMQ